MTTQPACKKQFCTAILTIVVISFAMPSVAQHIPFIPPAYNYTTDHYNAGNQNWAIAQGNNGVIYFGNDNGMLSYDGVNWTLHYLPNNLSVKSIYVDIHDNHERIYVGSFEEFGYFESNETNQLTYHSLSRNIQGHQFHNDEIWSIYPFNGKLYFQTFATIFVYDGQEVQIQKPYPAVLYFFPVDEKKMFAQLIDSDFCFYDGENFQSLFTRDRWNDDNIVAILPYEDDWLLVTSKNGLYRFSEKDHTLDRWEISSRSELVHSTINRAILSSDTYIFGTLNSGIFAIDKNGAQKWHIHRNNGLNNNTVLALFRDRERTIWAALDNGISNIRTHSLLSFFEPSDNQIGPVEDILFQDNQLYLATNQGIYNYPDSRGNLSRIPGFDIQSWFIKSFDHQIFVGHNLGTSLLQDFKEIRIPEANTGGMDIKQATINGKNILIESSYTSLLVYTQNNTGNWAFSHRVEGFSDLIKNLEIDHAGNIWAGHMYKGIYRLKLDSELRNVVEIENYLSFDSTQVYNYHPIKVMKLRGRIVFADGNRFYTYDDIEQKIIPFELLNNDLAGFADTHRIISVNDTLFWFICHKEYLLVEYSGNRYSIKDRIPYTILNNPPNAGRANILVTGDNISYFGMNGGIAKYSFFEEQPEVASELQVASITFHSRNDEQLSYLNPSQKGVIAFQHNNISFRFLYPEFSKKIFQIECFLQGYDSRWLNTDANRSASYYNLPPGDYTLYAQVKDSSGKILSSLNYSFSIKNPWYKTWWAYLLYFLIVGSITLFLIKRHIYRIVRRKQKLFEEQENRRLVQIERQEKEITTLQNEKLEAELIYKGKELASAAMTLINHSELLKNLRENVQSLILTGKIHRYEGNELLKMIENNIPEEDEWNLFQSNFDLIHQNFFRNLKDRYPSLTPTDLKLCSLLRLNYSSKEIADMLNISIRGVEAARYRLRKKLSLGESDNLVDFMINFK
ncbi:triple tyrosine motif-containing protein [Proteiniphilum sp.]|uniref:triple tyrosine motif-containing protein n=1 Tax=Proteiniphilum sp. TaxID=1926877 RepID=UPI002B212AD0|nr:triple tyrosine motif-containing protein [Proteiniphilum sp.]MEA4919041.1 triple tyrosine motif-containing protein [Proteiniphilum sp.]